jgi:hypothetical protein
MVYMLEFGCRSHWRCFFRNIATFSFVIFISDKSCFAVEIQHKLIVMTALLILWFDTCQQIVCNARTTFIFNNVIFEHCCMFSLTCWCSFLIGLSKSSLLMSCGAYVMAATTVFTVVTRLLANFVQRWRSKLVRRESLHFFLLFPDQVH